jgi:hypothetical protein
LFFNPDAGNVGSLQRRVFNGPSYANYNFAVVKDTKITERQSLQFRADFYNLFNHPNFTNVVNDLSAGNFGTVSSQTLPRWWQIGAKLEF